MYPAGQNVGIHASTGKCLLEFNPHPFHTDRRHGSSQMGGSSHGFAAYEADRQVHKALSSAIHLTGHHFTCNAEPHKLRPRMKVQGVWLQSVGLILFVADVHVAHDSSLTCEATLQHTAYLTSLLRPETQCLLQAVARGLERCAEACRDRGIQMPKEICVWVILA